MSLRNIRGWFVIKKKPRKSQRNKHYQSHKELARHTITSRVVYWNQVYNFKFNKIAIRNQKSRWGSCSSLKNLNFNYKLIFLPAHLLDYIVVHEICHLKEMNHGKKFWLEVEKTIPDYRQRITELKTIEQKFSTRMRTEPLCMTDFTEENAIVTKKLEIYTETIY